MDIASFAPAFKKRFTGDVLRKIEKSEDGCASLVKYRLAPGIEYSLTQA